MDATYLKNIKIKGLLGYKDVSWEVFRDVNILGGDNGSGKSTIFHICFQLLGAGYLTDQHYASLADSVELTFRNGWRLCWDKRQVRQDFVRESGYSYHNIEANKVEKDGSILIQRVRATDEHGNMMPVEEVVKAIPTSFASSFEQNVLENQRLKGDKNLSSDDKTYLDILLSSCIAMRNERVSQIFYDYLNKVAEQKGKENAIPIYISDKDDKYLSTFNEALMTFFGENYTIKAGMEARISFTNKKSGKMIKYQDLSLGEKEVLFLIIVVSNLFDTPVLLWLDEPDLGLHVDWQEKIIPTLQLLNPNMQLFISTHAPSMIVGNQERVTEMSDIETISNG